MDNFWTLFGWALIWLFLGIGIGCVQHGCTFIEIHKHNHK